MVTTWPPFTLLSSPRAMRLLQKALSSRTGCGSHVFLFLCLISLLRFSETIEKRQKMCEQITLLHLPQPAPQRLPVFCDVLNKLQRTNGGKQRPGGPVIYSHIFCLFSIVSEKRNKQCACGSAAEACMSLSQTGRHVQQDEQETVLGACQ